MTKLSWCPECQIGLDNAESRVGKCCNCGATWDPHDPNLLPDDLGDEEEDFDELPDVDEGL